MRRNIEVSSAFVGVRSPICAVALALTAHGCGDTDVSTLPALPEAGPLYVVGTTLVSADVPTSYLASLSALEAAGSLDLSRAVELGAGGTFFGGGEAGSRSVYTASYEEPTIVRWEVQGDGSIVQRETLSFLNLGLSSAWTAASAPIYSNEKSYFLSEDTSELVIWSPTSMVLLGTIPLELEDRDGLVPAPHRQLAILGDRLIVTVHWQDPDDWTVFGGSTRVIAVDLGSDSIAEVSDDPRCNSLVRPSIAPDGTAFFSADSFYVPLRALRGSGFGADSCALRVVPPGAAFDQGYALSLEELTDGRPAGDLLSIGENAALLRVWHEELVSPATADNWDDVRVEAGYLWWAWDTREPRAMPIVDQEPSASDALVLSVDGRTLLTRFTEDGSSTTLLEVAADGTLAPAFTGPGYVDGIVRVR